MREQQYQLVNLFLMFNQKQCHSLGQQVLLLVAPLTHSQMFAESFEVEKAKERVTYVIAEKSNKKLVKPTEQVTLIQ